MLNKADLANNRHKTTCKAFPGIHGPLGQVNRSTLKSDAETRTWIPGPFIIYCSSYLIGRNSWTKAIIHPTLALISTAITKTITKFWTKHLTLRLNICIDYRIMLRCWLGLGSHWKGKRLLQSWSSVRYDHNKTYLVQCFGQNKQQSRDHRVEVVLGTEMCCYLLGPHTDLEAPDIVEDMSDIVLDSLG